MKQLEILQMALAHCGYEIEMGRRLIDRGEGNEDTKELLREYEDARDELTDLIVEELKEAHNEQ